MSFFGAPAPKPGGLFGAAPGPQTSLLGTSALNPLPPAGMATTSNLFQGGASTAVANTPAKPQSTVALVPSTKFNDLHSAIQTILNEADNLISSQSSIAKELQSRKLGEEIVENSTTSRQLLHDLTATSNTLVADDLFAKDLRGKVDQTVNDVIIASHIVDGFRDSQQSAHLKNHAAFPLEFFSRLTEQMQERLQRYEVIVEQIERKLASSVQSHQRPQAIATTLQTQNTSFLALASKVAQVQTEMQELKTTFTTLYKARTGSARDPFARAA